MNCYALQVRTTSEEKIMSLFKVRNPDAEIAMHFPKRSLNLRRAGKTVHAKLPVFPGYIFLELPDEENVVRYASSLRGIDGFYRFLRSNSDIAPLKNRDLELVLHFIKKASPIAGVSQVYFDEHDRIVVLSGPLSGLEGRIIKADKRKGRAKIKLDLYGDSFSIDLAFEVIQQAGKETPQPEKSGYTVRRKP